MHRKLGEGGYARVFACEVCAQTDDADDSMDLDAQEMVIKVSSSKRLSSVFATSIFLVLAVTRSSSLPAPGNSTCALKWNSD